MTNWLGLRDSTRNMARLAAVLLMLGGGPAIVSATAAEENTVRLTVDLWRRGHQDHQRPGVVQGQHRA